MDENSIITKTKKTLTGNMYTKVKSFVGHHVPPDETIADLRFNLLTPQINFCAANLNIPVVIVDGPNANDLPVWLEKIQKELDDVIATADKDEYQEIQTKYKNIKDASFVLSALALS